MTILYGHIFLLQDMFRIGFIYQQRHPGGLKGSSLPIKGDTHRFQAINGAIAGSAVSLASVTSWDQAAR